MPQEEAFAQLDAFVEAGGNLIDTADVDNGGVAEEQWADGIRPRVPSAHTAKEITRWSTPGSVTPG
jgi:aryl-alcohol dehydrogenase-like predicted oxidoreductase